MNPLALPVCLAVLGFLFLPLASAIFFAVVLAVCYWFQKKQTVVSLPGWKQRQFKSTYRR